MTYTYDNPYRHGKYKIYQDNLFAGVVRWLFVHDDYDGPPDKRCGEAKSIEDAIEQIEEMEEEKVNG